jgi:hypothetical protein
LDFFGEDLLSKISAKEKKDENKKNGGHRCPACGGHGTSRADPDDDPAYPCGGRHLRKQHV